MPDTYTGSSIRGPCRKQKYTGTLYKKRQDGSGDGKRRAQAQKPLNERDTAHTGGEERRITLLRGTIVNRTKYC